MAALSNDLENKFTDLTRGRASTYSGTTYVALMAAATSGAGAWTKS